MRFSAVSSIVLDYVYPESFDAMNHFQSGMYFIVFLPVVSVFS